MNMVPWLGEVFMGTPYMRLPISGLSRPGCMEIALAIGGEIESGRMPSGCRLPPVRVLAHQLGVSKNTVQQAYDELSARGLTVNRSRQGVFVAGSEDEHLSLVADRRSLNPPRLLDMAPPPVTCTDPDLIRLDAVFIDPQLLPLEQLNACFRSVLQNPGLSAFYDLQGYKPLREAIAARLRKRGIPATADTLIITTGSQQALDIVCRALSEKRIATENPAYGIGKSLFEMNGMARLGLAIDPFRPLDLTLWEQRLREFRPSLLYLTSNFQNPTGFSYGAAAVEKIAELSRELGFGILEDDWGSDMLSFSEYRPPFRALFGENVLYMNSFTKKLMPSLRIGYLAAPESLVPALCAAKRAATLGNPMLEEIALFEFLDRGYYDRHLKTLQGELDRRYRACLDFLENYMPDLVRWSKPGGGPLIWMSLPANINLALLRAEALKVGVVLADADDRFFGEPHLHGFPIGYAFNPLEKTLEALAKLSTLLEQMI